MRHKILKYDDYLVEATKADSVDPSITNPSLNRAALLIAKFVNKKTKKKILKPFQVNKKLMSKANPNAIFMHCLPVGRGEEVTDEVIDGKQSVVWR